MLIRICLIVAILAGLGALAITHVQVNQKIVTLRDDRDTQKTGREKAEKERDDTKAELDKTKTELETTKTELTSTKGQLDEVTKKVADAEGRATKAEATAAKAQEDKKKYQDELALWKAIGKPIDAIKKTLADYPKAVDARDAFAAENKVLTRRVDKLTREVAELRGEELPAPDLPAGLKGKIVQVDPKFDFVVLNIGGNAGVVERGELLINRKGRLIGKVRVTSVLPDKSIANVLRAWKQDEPFEGDEVLY